MLRSAASPTAHRAQSARVRHQPSRGRPAPTRACGRLHRWRWRTKDPPFPTVAACILDSYARRIGRELLHRSGDLLDDAKRLLAYEAIVLSHDAGVDLRFVYASSAAASLWRISVEDMIGMPSRLSAPADAREDRARMLSDASRDGVLSGYSGERVARDGTRFQIMDATLWTVDGYPDGPGQAVVFSRWEPIDDI